MIKIQYGLTGNFYITVDTQSELYSILDYIGKSRRSIYFNNKYNKYCVRIKAKHHKQKIKTVKEMSLNIYNKQDLIEKLLEEHEKGYSNFYSLVEISKALYGKEFTDAIWKHLNTNIEYTETSESVTMIESAIHPYIVKRLDEKRNK